METRSNHVLVGSVVLILFVVTALFAVWLARLNGNEDKEYDILFSQAVDGLAKGSPVNFSGVQSGQVKEIALYPDNPELVRVRITVNADTPILEGTKAAIQGVGFTGVSQVALDGAMKGAKPIACPDGEDRKKYCPFGVPVIPAKRTGLGALLSSAPKLLENLTTVTDRVAKLLDDRNRQSISGILANTDRLTKALADRGPEIAQTLAETRIAIQQAGDAAQRIGVLADSTNDLVTTDLKPTLQKLNNTIDSAKKSVDTLNGTIEDARPGVQSFSKDTMPQINQLIADMRDMSQALSAVAKKIDQQGATSILSAPALPDYKPSKGKAK